MFERTLNGSYKMFNLTWEKGRQLASVTYGTNVVDYEYNADGLRTKKTVNGVVYDYYWQGGKLVAMTVTSGSTVNKMLFYYDALGIPAAFTYNDSYYCYITNLQGDVIGIANYNGVIGTYTYDAWGNLIGTNTAGSTEEILLKNNPLRYRGYIYDDETGFYYLQTRYYDPEIGRFINADGYISTGTGVLGYNMYAYCNNNPVINVDSTGESLTVSIIIISAIALIGTIAFGVIEYNDAIENNQDNDPTNDENVVLETLKGMAKGFTAGLLVGGAIVSTGGVFAGVAGCTFLGAAPLQAYSLGAAVFNIATYVVPLFVDPSEDVNTEQLDPVIPGSNNYVQPPLQQSFHP